MTSVACSGMGCGGKRLFLLSEGTHCCWSRVLRFTDGLMVEVSGKTMRVISTILPLAEETQKSD